MSDARIVELYERQRKHMKRYEKTRLLWDLLSRDTDIFVEDRHNPKKAHVHSIFSIEVLALPDRLGRIILDIRRAPTITARKIICDRLEEGLKVHIKNRRSMTNSLNRIELKTGRGHSDPFMLEFSLHSGSHFCESTIPLVAKILDIYNIEDPDGFLLSDFELTRQTMIEFEDNWITYENWLRIRNRLPVMGA